MPGPLILLAAPLGAGVGWITKKGLEASGRSILSEADVLLDSTDGYIKARKTAFDKAREDLSKKFAALSEMLAEADRSLDPELIDGDEANAKTFSQAEMKNAKAAWERISAMKCRAKPSTFAFDPRYSDEQRRLQNIGMYYAHKAANNGHPIVAALTAGVVAAKSGMEFRDACVDYRNAIRSNCDAVRLGADSSLKAIVEDVEQFDRDLAILVPILKIAATPPPKAALVKQAREWAKMLDNVRQEYFSDE